MIEGIVGFIGTVLFIGFICMLIAMADGWSPAESWWGFQKHRLAFKKEKRLFELEVKRKEAEIEAIRQENLDRIIRGE